MAIRNERVTMQDVARDANVSIATVSRVINKNYNVNEKTRDRVLKSMEKLSFLPNSIARSLKINSTSTIGFVVSDISNTYHISIARAVEDVIEKHNLNMTVCSTGNDKERELTYLKLLMSQNIAGLILNTTGKNNDFILEMNKYIPIILLNRRIDSPGFVGDLVGTDNLDSSYKLTEQLLKMGHRRILVVHGSLELSNGLERYNGYVQAMKDYGIDVGEDYPYQFNSGFTLEGGYQAVEYMRRLPQKPTAVFTQNNMSTIGVLRACKEYNINAPEDISMVAYDTIDNLNLMTTRPTVASYNTHSMGYNAGMAILERIKDPRIPNREFIEQSEIITGNAVGILMK
ncbi:MAG: LacI family transcriptional regulator [Anaerolineaceae bacterium]|nr:MAG: LacI family transcriptional regulator [Anaerolineaceae bacterium]